MEEIKLSILDQGLATCPFYEKHKMKDRESEEKYRLIFSNGQDAILIVDPESRRIVDANNAAMRLYGYSKKEILKLTGPDLSAEREKTDAAISEVAASTKKYHFHTRNHKKKNGTAFPVEISSGTFLLQGRKMICAIIRDITERKQEEEALLKAHIEMESRVQERTAELANVNEALLDEINERKRMEQELMEKNTALKVLLKQREEDRNELEGNILSNMKNLILPYIKKINKNKLMSKDLTYLNILESNLNEIISNFSFKLSSDYIGFTSREIQIANLIKDGKQDKDIMETLNISLETVKSHRRNIRKKLGIYSKRTNLRTHLLSLTK
jgi:PAS domain S-box-containing protein